MSLMSPSADSAGAHGAGRPAPKSANAADPSPNSADFTVALIDDDPVSNYVLTRYFEFHGFKVIAARDGVAGVELVKARRPSLVILDVMLPQLDGFAVLQKLRALDPLLPVIMLTLRNDPQDRVRGLMAGAHRYMLKPCSPVKVLDEAAKLLGLSERPKPVGGSLDPAQSQTETETDFDSGGYKPEA